MQDLQKMTIELDENETNLLLEALQVQPYNRVFLIIAKIRSEFLRQNPEKNSDNQKLPK